MRDDTGEYWNDRADRLPSSRNFHEHQGIVHAHTCNKPWLAVDACAVLHSSHAGAAALVIRAEARITPLCAAVAEVALADSVSLAVVDVAKSHFDDGLHVRHLHRHLLDWHLSWGSSDLL